MANRPEAVGRWPQHLPVGAIRVGGSGAHYDQAVRFYRDLVGLPLLESFAASYGEDGTIFGLSDTAVQLEIVRSGCAGRPGRSRRYAGTDTRQGVPEQYRASAQ